MTQYMVEWTPAGKGFAFGSMVAACANWDEAVLVATEAADKCDDPSVFWAVERETPRPGSASQPVTRKWSIGAPSPFRPGHRYEAGA